MVPVRIRAAALLLGLFGIGLLVYTVALTVPLLVNRDPMFELELIVSAILAIGAVGAIVGGVGLIRSVAWARPLAVGVAVLLIIGGGVVILPNLGTIGAYGPPLIDPLFWVLGATGLLILALVAKPYR